MGIRLLCQVGQWGILFRGGWNGGDAVDLPGGVRIFLSFGRMAKRLRIRGPL